LIDSSFDVNTTIFHYGYQWNKRDERQRNEAAVQEHLTYMKALFSRNASLVERACRAHLTAARDSLVHAIA
jgi:DNA-binding GntR family transcriptional regulator